MTDFLNLNYPNYRLPLGSYLPLFLYSFLSSWSVTGWGLTPALLSLFSRSCRVFSSITLPCCSHLSCFTSFWFFFPKMKLLLFLWLDSLLWFFSTLNKVTVIYPGSCSNKESEAKFGNITSKYTTFPTIRNFKTDSPDSHFLSWLIFLVLYKMPWQKRFRREKGYFST